MDKLMQFLMSVLFVVLTLICIISSLMILPIMAKKIKYEVETFEELKCNELGYFKKDKK